MSKSNVSNSLFKDPRFKYLAKIVSFKDINSAKKSSEKLRNEFNKAVSKVKKLRIARAAQYAANRAKASSRRKNLSQKEKKEYKQISRIYETLADELFEKRKENNSGNKKLRRKLPKNPNPGEQYEILTTLRNGQKRIVTFVATGKSGFGKWKIIKNKPLK